MSSGARSDFKNITDYISGEFGILALSRFVIKFDRVLDIFAESPMIYRIVFKKQKIRRCVLSKQCIIFFKVRGGIVEIVSIFDTRQDPRKIKTIIY